MTQADNTQAGRSRCPINVVTVASSESAAWRTSSYIFSFFFLNLPLTLTLWFMSMVYCTIFLQQRDSVWTQADGNLKKLNEYSGNHRTVMPTRIYRFSKLHLPSDFHISERTWIWIKLKKRLGMSCFPTYYYSFSNWFKTGSLERFWHRHRQCVVCTIQLTRALPVFPHMTFLLFFLQRWAFVLILRYLFK